jgi:hypothetical protein
MKIILPGPWKMMGLSKHFKICCGTAVWKNVWCVVCCYILNQIKSVVIAIGRFFNTGNEMSILKITFEGTKRLNINLLIIFSIYTACTLWFSFLFLLSKFSVWHEIWKNQMTFILKKCAKCRIIVAIVMIVETIGVFVQW